MTEGSVMDEQGGFVEGGVYVGICSEVDGREDDCAR